jgi:hypothetical protein
MAKSNMCHPYHQSKNKQKTIQKLSLFPLNLSHGYIELFWRGMGSQEGNRK